MESLVSSFVLRIFADSKSADLVMARDGAMEIVRNLHSGYFDGRGSFQIVVDLYYWGWTNCTMGTL